MCICIQVKSRPRGLTLLLLTTSNKLRRTTAGNEETRCLQEAMTSQAAIRLITDVCHTMQ